MGMLGSADHMQPLSWSGHAREALHSSGAWDCSSSSKHAQAQGSLVHRRLNHADTCTNLSYAAYMRSCRSACVKLCALPQLAMRDDRRFVVFAVHDFQAIVLKRLTKFLREARWLLFQACTRL